MKLYFLKEILNFFRTVVNNNNYLKKNFLLDCLEEIADLR